MTTTAEVDARRELAKQRTEWLQDFQEAHRETRTIFRERMAEILIDFSESLQRCIKVMDRSVSRGIHQQAQESWNQIGETFAAILGTLNKDESSSSDRDSERGSDDDN